MDSHQCKYCYKEFTTYQKLGGHVSRCNLNPNYKKTIQKIKDSRTHEILTYKVVCKKAKCKKTFKLQLTENQFNRNNFRKYCNRTCSGISKRPRSQETKDKIRKSIYELDQNNTCLIQYKNCEFCNNIFVSTITLRSNKNCSKECAKQSMIIKQKAIPFEVRSKRNLKRYQNGHPPGGGRTKWLKYKDIKVQGTYELRVCNVLDKLLETDKIHGWEYTKDRFPYIGLDDKPHTYLIDFKVYDTKDSFHYLEVKGYKTEKDDLKWAAVREAGYRLDVWFNDDITYNESIIPDTVSHI